VPFADLISSVDALVKEGGDQFYVEVVRKHGHRAARPTAAGSETDTQ
jgi:hypothetical protein